MRISRYRPIVGAAVVSLLVAACADQPTIPELSSSAASLSSGNAGSNRHPNSVRYSNTGAQPATGRSGSATLQVRALIGSTGATVVEASTGMLDGGTPPGKIDKTQVKLLAQGGLTATKNYNGLSAGGYWTATYTELLRNDDVQVQANVSGIDRRRTDVVTVTAPVKRRPDPSVVTVVGPADALPGQLVTFAASVTELNGDVGATANCVLTVDGAPVDEATGIWVDAGSTVSCAFGWTFSDTGTYAIGVELTGVTPGDWDASNNSAATSITIRTAGAPIATGYMQAHRLDRSWAYAASNNGDYPFTSTQTGTENVSQIYFHGYDPAVIPLPLQRIDVETSADGSPTHTRTFTAPAWNYEWTDGINTHACWGYSENGESAEACSADYPSYGWQQTWYNYHRFAGVVTYSGSWWDSLYGSDTYSYNYVYGDGIPFTLGTQAGLKLSYVDADGSAHTVDRSVTVEDRSYESWVNGSNGACYEDWSRGGTTCYSDTFSGTFLFGATSW